MLNSNILGKLGAMNNRLKYNIYGVLIYSAWAFSMDIFLRSTFKLPLELLALLDCFWIFYSGYAFLYFLFLGPPTKKLLSIPLAVVSVVGSFGINLLYMVARKHYYDPSPYTLREVFYTTLQEFSFFFIYSVGYFFLVRYLQNQKQLRAIEQQQADDYQRRLQLEKTNALLQQQKLLLEKDLP